jgi:hypothetical protein
MEPEDDLEFAVLNEMTKATTKGQSINLTRIDHPQMQNAIVTDRDITKEFRVEMRVNGHSAKVTRNNDMLEQFKNT